MDIQSLNIPTQLCSLRSSHDNQWLAGKMLLIAFQAFSVTKIIYNNGKKIYFWLILKCNMADASGWKNSHQLFSYSYSFCDKSRLFKKSEHSLLLFMKHLGSLPSVSPSWPAGLLKCWDILVDSSSCLLFHYPPGFFTFSASHCTKDTCRWPHSQLCLFPR